MDEKILFTSFRKVETITEAEELDEETPGNRFRPLN